MNRRRILPYFIALALCSAVPTASLDAVRRVKHNDTVMPYAAVGLDKRAAAAHLLDRFSFGAVAADIDNAVAIGLEAWFEAQLNRSATNRDLDNRLSQFNSLSLSNEEILRRYPQNGRVRRELVDAGRIDQDTRGRELREVLRDYSEEMGYRPQRELIGELIAQKIFRAVESPNQMEEVLVDFWFNHFYVSVVDNQCRRFVGTYERDAIRPHVFASFADMLFATAKHPAMLLYLDNAQSSAPEGVETTGSRNRDRLRQLPGEEGRRYRRMFERAEEDRRKRESDAQGDVPPEFRRRRGVNENYARELLELHTLGVDGGYAQSDVEEVARAFTGWTVLPDGRRRDRIKEQLQRNAGLVARIGFETDGDFLFNADWHDAGDKTILERHFDDVDGVREGEAVLTLLAGHPSTARHISKKLAVRFISDDPPAELVERLAETFLESGGDMRAMLREIAYSPEFWADSARRAKIKSPFELAVSGVRVLQADVKRPGQLNKWIERMGQPLYRYQAPTGFPDRAAAWVNAGALLHRMNFGLTLASGRVRGVIVDLDRLTGGREPESPDAALVRYATVLLPGRDLEPTIAALQPMVRTPDVANRVREQSEADRALASRGNRSGMANDTVDDTGDMIAGDMSGMVPEAEAELDDAVSIDDIDPFRGDAIDDDVPVGDGIVSLSQVVGLILGSPEFQRR